MRDDQYSPDLSLAGHLAIGETRIRVCGQVSKAVDLILITRKDSLTSTEQGVMQSYLDYLSGSSDRKQFPISVKFDARDATICLFVTIVKG